MRSKTITLPVDERAIAALAGRQRGYVTRRQLLELGISSTAIVRRQASGRLIPLYAGVYAVGHLPILPQDRAAGALLACGPGAVLSHGSAAAAWGIFKSWEPPFEVNVRVGGYEVDAWFPEHRVIVELDGYAFHSARDRFEADRERDAALLALGLVTVRVVRMPRPSRPAPPARPSSMTWPGG